MLKWVQSLIIFLSFSTDDSEVKVRWYHSSAARTVCTGCFLYLAPFLLLPLLLWWFWMLDTTTRICETLTCGLCKFSQAAASGLHLSFQTHPELHKPWKNIYCILSKCFSNWSKMFQKWKPGVVPSCMNLDWVLWCWVCTDVQNVLCTKLSCTMRKKKWGSCWRLKVEWTWTIPLHHTCA